MCIILFKLKCLNTKLVTTHILNEKALSKKHCGHLIL